MKLLKNGDNGLAVQKLQKALKKAGYYEGPIDGDFGTGTERAVREFQGHESLMVDGVVGDRVQNALKGFSRDKKQLTDDDIVRAAKSLRVPEAAIRAVSEVESSGGGFYSDGLMKILFERHIMNRYLRKAGLTLLQTISAKARPDLVNSKPGGYRGGKLEHTRLAAAVSLNPEVAHQSISMGRYQIMGFHFAALGFKSAIAMYKELSKSEGAQLVSFCKFIRNDKALHAALKAQDWVKFARIYNGPKYEINKYDTKLAEAYARHSS